MANGVKSINLFSGASSATRNVSKPDPWLQVTRADIVGMAMASKLSTIENKTPGNAGNLIFPQDIGPHHMVIGISELTRQSNAFIGGGTRKNGSSNILKTNTILRLPLPENIKDINEISYTEGETLSLSSFTGSIIKGLNNTAKTMGLDDAFSAALNNLKASTGTAPNQMLTILLKGPKYKRHSFSWKLYPKNKTESEIIRKIISNLKENARPSISTAGAFFLFPHIFNLSFFIGDKDQNKNSSTYMFAFKPAVIENISVNYTPSGQVSLYKETGAPDGVELTVSFIELEYWLGNEGVSEAELGSQLLTGAANGFYAAITEVQNFFTGSDS